MTNEEKKEGSKKKMYQKKEGNKVKCRTEHSQQQWSHPESVQSWCAMARDAFSKDVVGQELRNGVSMSLFLQGHFWQGLMDADEKVSGLCVVFDKEDKIKWEMFARGTGTHEENMC